MSCADAPAGRAPRAHRSSPTTSSRRSSSSRRRGAGRLVPHNGPAGVDRRRSSSASLVPPERARGAAGGLRARPRRALHPPHPPPVLGRPRRLPARLVHDEVQPEGLPTPAPRCPGSPRSTRPRRHLAPRDGSSCSSSSRSACARSPAWRAVTLQPAAGAAGELTGLLLMRAYHDARGESPAPGDHPRLGPRDEPGLGDARGLRGDDRRHERPRRRRPGRAPGALLDEDVAGHHADEPEHARTVRGGHRRDRRGGPRGRRAALLRRRQPERHPRDRAPRRHGLRHRAPERAQDLRHPARRGRTRAPARSP